MQPDIKNILFRFYLRQCFPSDFTAARSIQTQNRIFHNLLSLLSPTQLGKDLKLNQIRNYEDFRKSISITHYDFYESYIEKIKAGESRVMTADKVLYFGKTAGTTSGKSKLIPVTASFIRKSHVSGTFFGLSRLHSFSEDIDILSHKNFVIAGGVYEQLANSQIQVADISAIMMRNVPLPFRTIYVPDNALITHASWERKLALIPNAVKNADVGSMIGIPTWHLTVLNKMREEIHFEKLTDVWKNLRFFFHGGVNFEPYRKHFKEFVGRDDFIFYEIYNATEGFFGAQAYREGGDLLLLTDTAMFYEFIAFSDYSAGNMHAIELKDIKQGIPYVLVISTINGLVRYIIGDVLTFTNLDPFMFRITGRTQEFINAFGEDLLLSHVLNALMKTNEKYGSSVRDYTVAPQYINLHKKGKIQFLIEFVKAPDSLEDYALELDRQLQHENSNYAQKRNNSLALNSLEVIAAPEGIFYKWLESKGKLGGQNKVPDW